MSKKQYNKLMDRLSKVLVQTRINESLLRTILLESRPNPSNRERERILKAVRELERALLQSLKDESGKLWDDDSGFLNN